MAYKKDITDREMRILVYLNLPQTIKTAGRIAYHLDIDLSNLTRTLEKMTGKAWINKTQNKPYQYSINSTNAPLNQSLATYENKGDQK